MENEILGLTFPCRSCGAYLKYAPGTTHLICEYCNTQDEITALGEVEELDYAAFMATGNSTVNTITEHFVKCDTCNATSTIKPMVTAASCPYCAAPFVLSNAYTENVIRPNSILPFKLDEKTAKNEFIKWINALWYAPNNLKSVVSKLDYFKGVYIPYWTYDTKTRTQYTGQRGEHYYVSESYTTTENGQSVTRTRQVQKTRWYSAQGNVTVSFDDLLVTASKSLPEQYVRNLEPWDLENLVAFSQSYLSGFTTEKYQINLKDGFDIAKTIAEPGIRSAIRNDIGGDDQRINTADTNYSNITFKHLLFPLYVSVYKYNGKLYQFLINARTGEVQGQRPYSAIKIVLTILLALLVIVIIGLYANQQ